MLLKRILKSFLLCCVRIVLVFPPVAVWKKFISAHIGGASVVADIGGGEGEIANHVAPRAKHVFVLDKEETSMEGADGSLYVGSLRKAYANLAYPHIVPIKGDAVNMPFAEASLDAITTGEMLEHLNTEEKRAFFEESSRVLKGGGIMLIMTPNAAFIRTREFWFPEVCRRVIPKAWVSRLPGLLRGPWLEQTVEQWEHKVGHYERGCELDRLRDISHANGFEEIDHRFMHTAKTFFWHQLMFTFPLIYILLLPLIRISYFWEYRRNSGEGASLMVAFRKSRSFRGSASLKSEERYRLRRTACSPPDMTEAVGKGEGRTYEWPAGSAP